MKGPFDVYDYCRAYKGYFYTWEEDAEVIAIRQGKTICYTSFLIELLEFLAPNGAPPLGTLLLVVIATSEDSHEMLAHVEQILDANYFRLSSDKSNRIASSFALLKRLSALPPRYKRGQLRKQAIQTLFDGGHNLVSSRKIKTILKSLKSEGLDSGLLSEPIGMSIGVLYADLKPLDVLAKKFAGSESLLQRLAGIPPIEDLPFHPEEPITERGIPKDFVEELEFEPHTFHVGALIRRIWTGLAIPFHSNHPSVQPLGGVSDISNRGTLDKLLISEYANDDILFLSRLANGEALFINRETPPETDKLQRIILIDSSLQSWGTPRTIAYALILAMAHHPKTDISVKGYAVGDNYYPVGFATIHELIDSLQYLDASLNASAGMKRFFEAIKETGKHEIIFISSPQGYQQSAVQSLIHEWIGEIGYCITADEQGEVSVFRKRARGLAELQTFALPLKELWKNPPARAKTAETQHTGADLASDYPILFPWPNKIRSELIAPDGQIFIVSKDNVLLRRWKSDAQWRQKGWFYVTDKLPKGNCNYRVGLSSKGEYLLLVHTIAQREVHLINLSTKAAAVAHIDSYVTRHANPNFIFWEDGFVIKDGLAAWKFHLAPSSDRHDAPAVRLTKLDVPLQVLEEKKQPFLSLPVSDLIHSSTLKNINRISISYSGTFMINNHELKVHHNSLLKFTGGAGTGWIPASPQAANTFQFPDGSTVSINRAGLLILKSSNLSIGSIYIPSVLDAPIGAATREHYAGTDFYNPDLVAESKRMTAVAFYDRFIEGFISQIKHYATSVKTN